jgi:hypothetical protein
MLFKITARILLIVLIVTLWTISVPTAQAQSSNVIHVCVSPIDPKAGELYSPYLLTFQNTTSFGLLIPHAAHVVIYSETHIIAALYTINTDTQTGGYRKLEPLGDIRNASQIPAERACAASEPYRTILDNEKLLGTVPIPVSANHALIIQIADIDTVSPDILGVFSFTFHLTETPSINFQLLQVSNVDPSIDIKLPMLTDSPTFTALSNKEFSIRQSLPENDSDFDQVTSSQEYRFVKADLSSDLGIDLFEMMVNGQARIYPRTGFIDTYRGAFIRLTATAEQALRQSEFSAGMQVRALDGVVALLIDLAKFENDPLRLNNYFGVVAPDGRLSPESAITVKYIEEETGQLVVDDNGHESIIQAWLVEPIQ